MAGFLSKNMREILTLERANMLGLKCDECDHRCAEFFLSFKDKNGITIGTVFPFNICSECLKSPAIVLIMIDAASTS